MIECVLIPQWVLAVIGFPMILIGGYGIYRTCKDICGVGVARAICFIMIFAFGIPFFGYGISPYLPCITVVP